MGFEEGTGRIDESQMFGEVLNKKDFKEYLQEKNEGRYLDYETAMADVEANQPWDNPGYPDPQFAADLHYTIGEQIYPDKDYSKLGLLKFFTAIGSTLDYDHNVDGFFRYIDQRGKVRDITMDVSKTAKERGIQKGQLRADVLIFVPKMTNSEFSPNNPEYIKWLNWSAEAVIDAMHSQRRK